MKRIVLKKVGEDLWQVIELSNTTFFCLGWVLKKSEVDCLIDDESWDVKLRLHK